MLELPWLNRRSYLRPNPNPGTPVSPPRDLGGRPRLPLSQNGSRASACRVVGADGFPSNVRYWRLADIGLCAG